MKIPRVVTDLTEAFQKLPGIGPKTAQRLTYYLLHIPQEQLDDFADALSDLKKNSVLCSVCKNVTEEDPCEICSDIRRDKSVILVVEQPLDVIAIDKTSKYNGLYHVLHGSINPLENIGPDEIFISQLLERIELDDGTLVEVIIATNPTMEGDATAMYLAKRVKELKSGRVKVTRLGMGIPTGADLEYADEVTLTQAIEGRREM